jgi:hypothetical protein
MNPVRFEFSSVNSALGELGKSPYLPLPLTYGEQSIATAGLLDTGSSINVLPYNIGLQLGAIWENQRVPVFGATREGHCGLGFGSPFRTVIRGDGDIFFRARSTVGHES